MDWILEISEFPKLKLAAVSGFDSERDGAKAVQKYDKAVMNAINDSVDIAIIELRKLAVLYPETGQINVLLGCCQMLEGRFDEAKRNFERALLKYLPETMHDKVLGYIEEVTKEKEESEQVQNNQKRQQQTKINAPVPEIINASTGRWKKRKMAGEKEKREIIQRLNSPQVAETFISDKIEINWPKIAIAAIILILAAGIITVTAVFIPKLINAARQNSGATADKLEWLLNELDIHKQDNKTIEDILNGFDEKFYPGTSEYSDPDVSKDVSSEPDPITPTPSVSPEPTAGDRIVRSYEKIKEAEETGRSDPAKVMVLIKEVRSELDGIDDNVTADDLQVNVGDILQIAYDLERSVVSAACYPFYRDGKASIENKDPASAVEFFKKAYDINPDYLEGGNTYNLAKAYAAIGQQATANIYFQYVVDTFPGTDYAGWSAARIKPVVSEGE